MKRLPKAQPPHPKNYSNYYEYKADLIQFNERQYAEYLDKCKIGEAIYIEKEILSPKHEKRIKDYDDLISGL